MRWRSGRRSSNVEDRRRGGGALVAGGGVGGLVILAIVLLLGGDPSALLESGGDTAPPPEGQDEGFDFASVVLASTEEVWGRVFAESGSSYEPPQMVVFANAAQSGCGMGSSAMGPFYCPLDRTIYLDLTFFQDLARLGGAGDFAAAYVIGHEVGHHVQNLLGTSDRVREEQMRSDDARANELSVGLELQADCYAGVWAARSESERRWLEPGDVQEGMDAAAAIGDDRLQRRAGREVVPESFTHGTSAQRQRWLRTGLESGNPSSCTAVES